MSAKLKIEDCHKIAEERGGKCLSAIYVNIREKLEWQCSKNHRWPASLGNVKNNKSWCPYCAKNIKLTHKFVKKQIDNLGGKLLSKYEKSGINMQIQCKKCEYVWPACWDNLKQGYFCPMCALKDASERNRLKNGLELAIELAKNNGGKCLSIEYTNVDTKMLWECKLGHRWPATLYKIKNRRQWCPYCSRYKTQNELASVIYKIFPNFSIKQNFREFSWLKTKKNGKQEIDIYIPEIKLAIEYDGEQHFMPVCFGGISKKEAIKNFKKQIKMDKIKNEMIKNNPRDVDIFIRFDYTEKEKFCNIEYIINKLKLNGVKI